MFDVNTTWLKTLDKLRIRTSTEGEDDTDAYHSGSVSGTSVTSDSVSGTSVTSSDGKHDVASSLSGIGQL